MDRETRAFAERHFRDLGGRVHGGCGLAPSGVAFVQFPDGFSYADFVKGFLLPNLPCVFSSAFTEGWGSRRRWVTPAGKPDFEYLLKKYGEEGRRRPEQPGRSRPPGTGCIPYPQDRQVGYYGVKTFRPVLDRKGIGIAQTLGQVERARTELRPPRTARTEQSTDTNADHWNTVGPRKGVMGGDVVVPVANCEVQEYNSNPKEHMPFRDYISYWKEYIRGGCSSPRGCLYLKDWHLCRNSSVEDLEEVFTLPVYFSSDWLNEFWDTLDVDDYRFVYAGPKGTWSPFHADIFRSFSWSVNICGRKKWLFFPPGQEEALRDCYGNLPYDVTSSMILDAHLHPRLQPTSPPLEVIQEAGEMVFVPSGWHHQVHNLDDTISINHNWVNGFNLANMWHFLQQELQAVQREVSEWRDSMPDWHHHCQVIMKSCTGINFEEFYHFLKIIAEKRFLILKQGLEEAMGDSAGLELGLQQAAFDVGRLAEVLASVVAHPDFQTVDTSSFSSQPEELLRQLEDAIATTEVF